MTIQDAIDNNMWNLLRDFADEFDSMDNVLGHILENPSEYDADFYYFCEENGIY